MATLVDDKTKFEPIYQLETTDPVQGGPNGIDNRQAQQLANRTAYLREKLEGKLDVQSMQGEVAKTFDAGYSWVNGENGSYRTFFPLFPLAVENDANAGSCAGFSLAVSELGVNVQRVAFHVAHLKTSAPSFKADFSIDSGGKPVRGIGLECSLNTAYIDPCKLYLILDTKIKDRIGTATWSIQAIQLYGSESMRLDGFKTSMDDKYFSLGGMEDLVFLFAKTEREYSTTGSQTDTDCKTPLNSFVDSKGTNRVFYYYPL